MQYFLIPDFDRYWPSPCEHSQDIEMSFTEMIDAVDRQSGLTDYQINTNLKQGDTSMIDNIAQLQREQRGGLRGLEAVEHDLAQLKKAVRHVIPDINDEKHTCCYYGGGHGGFFRGRRE